VIAEGKMEKQFPTGPDGAMEDYIMEEGMFPDLAIVKAWKADETGNLVFRKTARNFNAPAATCGKICIAEVEEIVPTGSLDPDAIHLPGIYVNRIIQAITRNVLSSAPYVQRRRNHGLGSQSNGGTRRSRTARRLVCKPRHRHPDAGVQLHPRRC
jgi:acyl CoA:acetate/3-ketoacid CoA transferase